MKTLSQSTPLLGRVYRIRSRKGNVQDVLCVQLAASGHGHLRFCPIRLPAGTLLEAIFLANIKHDEVLESWPDLLDYLAAHKSAAMTRCRLHGGPCAGAEYVVDLGKEERPGILVAWLTKEAIPGVALYSFPDANGDSHFLR